MRLKNPTEQLAKVLEGAFVFPKPFEATYTADYRGLPISATGIRSLRREDAQDSQRYIFSSRAVSLFAKLNEASTFTLESNSWCLRAINMSVPGLAKTTLKIFALTGQAV